MLKKFINWSSNLIDGFFEKMNEGEPYKGGSIILKCVKLDPAARLPTKAHTGIFEDAAFDLYATEDLLFQYGQRKMIETKLSFIIPDGYWLKLRERSGLANKGIHLLGGVIDSGYTGEVKVILWASSPDPVSVTTDKAICQFTIEKLNKAVIEELSFDTFRVESNKRKRGEKGFGSSDAKDSK